MIKNISKFQIRRPVSRRGFLAGSLFAATAASAAPIRLLRSVAAEVPREENRPNLEFIVLSRLTYGSTPALRERYRKLATTDEKRFRFFIEEQLYPERLADAVCDSKLKAAKFESLDLSLEDAFQKYIVKIDAIKEREKNVAVPGKNSAGAVNKVTAAAQPLELTATSLPLVDENKVRMTVANEVEAATWLRAVYSERQVFERVTEFWHDHFNIHAFDQKISPTFASFDRDVIRKNAFGNFREMLGAVAQSPAMLLYLDNHLNQSGNPNENYARELFELHTLGSENYLGTMDRDKVKGYTTHLPPGYVDGDVYEAARCFTGWKIDQGNNSKNTGAFSYFEPWHDRFQKIVMGRAIVEHQPPLKDGNDVLDYLSSHVGTSHYIARKICRHFVCDEPSNAFVEKIARTFRGQHNAKDQLRQTFKAVFLSEEFRSTWGKKIKRPFESTVEIIRNMTNEFYPSQPFLQNYEKAGQRRFACRTPDGYSDTLEKWASPNSLFERWRLTNQLVLGKIDGVNVSQDWFKIARETCNGLDEKARTENGELFLHRLALAVLGRKISSEEMKAVMPILLQQFDWGNTCPLVVATLYMSPTTQRC